MLKPNWQIREIIQYTYVKMSAIFNGPPFTNIVPFFKVIYSQKKILITPSNKKKKKKEIKEKKKKVH